MAALLRRKTAPSRRHAIRSGAFHEVFLTEFGSMAQPVPPRYYVPGAQTWAAVPVQYCPSEDANGNLRLDAGEDRNDDTMLTPGNVAAAVVSSEAGVTDANGIASVRVVYPKSFANWVEVQLRVTGAVVAGTEGIATVTFILPAAVGDLAVNVSPPGGVDSQFGRQTGCDNSY